MCEEVKVSVIVPVYNVEGYLRQCMDSITGQTLREIEIICVDDGSTDGSPIILKEYAAADARVSIIIQENLYSGAARNNGLMQAHGEYVIFWDSDDYFHPTALELMYKRAKETDADVCICNAWTIDSQTGAIMSHSYIRKPYPQTDVFNINDFKDRIYTFTSTVAWNKLVRRQLLLDENIRFSTAKHVNDVSECLLVLTLAKRITLVNKRLIYYRNNRPNSLMNTYSEDVDAVFEAYESAERILIERRLLTDPIIHQSVIDKAVGIYFYKLPFIGSYEMYEKYYRRLTVDNEMLQRGEANLNANPNMTRYLGMKDMSAGDFLLSEFRRLSDQSDEQKHEISTLKKDVGRLSDKNEKLKVSFEQSKADVKAFKADVKTFKADVKTLKAEVKSLKSELKERGKERDALKKKTESQDKLLALKSVRAALRLSRWLGRNK